MQNGKFKDSLIIQIKEMGVVFGPKGIKLQKIEKLTLS